MEMKKWVSKVRRVVKEEGGGRRRNINLAIVSANNDYAGFGPGTAHKYVDVNLHPCTQSTEYCRGYENGYNNEADFLG